MRIAMVHMRNVSVLFENIYIEGSVIEGDGVWEYRETLKRGRKGRKKKGMKMRHEAVVTRS